jgi:hypothetical protein
MRIKYQPLYILWILKLIDVFQLFLLPSFALEGNPFVRSMLIEFGISSVIAYNYIAIFIVSFIYWMGFDIKPKTKYIGKYRKYIKYTVIIMLWVLILASIHVVWYNFILMNP